MKRIFLFVFLILSGCSEGKNYLKEGFKYLSTGEYMLAEKAFSQAIENEPSSQAYFGRGVSRLLSFVEIIDYLYTLLGGHPSGSSFTPFSEIDENYFLYDTLRRILWDMRDMLEGSYSDFSEVLKGKFYLEVNELPVILGREEILNLRGRWKRGDIFFLRATVGFLEGVLDLLLSQNLRADYFTAFEYIKLELFSKGLDLGDSLKCLNLSLIANAIVYIFSISHDLLTINNEDYNENGISDGEELWQKSSEKLKSFLSDLSDGVNSSISGKDISFFLYEESEGIKIATLYPQTSSPVDIYLEVNEMFEESLSTIILSFDNAQNVLLWDRDVSPFLATLLLPLIKSRLLGDETVNVLAGKLTWHFLNRFLSQIFGHSLGFSPFSFFEQPKSFRNFLPLFRNDFPDPASWNFALEWECSSYAGPIGNTQSFPSGSLFCTDKPIIDSPHFTDPFFSGRNVEPVPQDGITTPAPYIPFQDPSFGKLFLTDVFSLKYIWNSFPSAITYIDRDEGLKSATNGEINALIQYIFASIIIPLLGEDAPGGRCY